MYLVTFKIVSGAPFNILITVIIIYNTYILASYRYDQSPEDESFRDDTDLIFVFVFTIEIVLKLVALGFKGFRIDSFNIFDAFIVLLSYLEMGLHIASVESPLLESLRALRALRMLKLARFNAGMRKIMQQTFLSMKAIGSFSALLFLFIIVWTLMGMEIFAY